MIHKFSKESQFIITTFRPELIPFSSQIFKVIFNNKFSHVNHISIDDAQTFIEEKIEIDR